MIGYPDRDMHMEFSQLTDAALAGDLPLAEIRLRALIEPSEQFLNSLQHTAEIAARVAKPAADKKPKADKGAGRKPKPAAATA
jgi:hypothetical protein